MSNGERKVKFLLEQGEIDFAQEFSFPDLKSDRGVPLRFDFVIFTDSTQSRISFLIEFQGSQHYEKKFQTAQQFARQQANDKRKRAYCAVKRIPLVAIPYTDYDSLTLDSILEQGHFFD